MRFRLPQNLFAKFLLILGPVFILLAVPGIWFLTDFETKQDREHFAARIGNHVSRVALSLGRDGALEDADRSRDLMSMLAVDRAFMCAELLDDAGGVVNAYPAVVGCTGQSGGDSIALPVGEEDDRTLRVRFTVAELLEARRVQYTIALSVIAFSFVVAVVASAIGFRLIVHRPLRGMRDAIRHMSETGERTTVPVRTQDELGTVIHAFNDMSERDHTRKKALIEANALLETSRSKLERLNEDLEARVQERTALLEAEKEKAEAANIAKTRFLANMSHELRTPLNCVIGFSDIMRGQTLGPLGDDRYIQFATDIHDSGAHLLKVINEILDIAKIESGSQTLHQSEAPVIQLLDGCRRVVAPLAEAKDVSFEADRGDLPANLRIRADQTKLLQILINLATNGVKFTEPGGTVRLTAARDDDGALAFAVSDTGIGMRANEIPEAMKPFSQIDSSLSRNQEGTGLGLPLAKMLTDLHGGSFRIDSVPGTGTTVTVTLPADRVLADAASAA